MKISARILFVAIGAPILASFLFLERILYALVPHWQLAIFNVYVGILVLLAIYYIWDPPETEAAATEIDEASIESETTK